MKEKRCPKHKEELSYDLYSELFICKKCYLEELEYRKARGAEEPDDAFFEDEGRAKR